MKARLGREFGVALCDHFNLPASQASDLKLHTGINDVFSASLTIMLTADDLAAIAARMGGKVPEPEQEPVSAHFDPPATDADLARFMQCDGKQYIVMNFGQAFSKSAAEAAAKVRAAADRANKRNP